MPEDAPGDRRRESEWAVEHEDDLGAVIEEACKR